MKDEGSLGSLQTAPEMVCQTVMPLKINKEPGGDASFTGKKGKSNQGPKTGQRALHKLIILSSAKKKRQRGRMSE